MSLSVYLSEAIFTSDHTQMIISALDAWSVDHHESLEESDIFLRLWTEEAETSEQMVAEAAMLRHVQNDDPESAPRQIIDLRFTATIPLSAELAGAQVILATAEPRHVWLARLADALGLTIVREDAVVATLQRDSHFRWRRHITATTGGMAQQGFTVVVSTYRGTLACDARDGSLLWQNPEVISGGVGRMQPPLIAGDTVYVTCCQEWLYALDSSTGQVRWRVAADDIIQCTPAIANGLIFVTAHDGYLYAFDATNGAQRWRCKTGPREYTWSSPIVHAGVVFTGSTGSSVFAVRARDGTILWQRLTAGTVLDSVLLADGVLYVAPACSSLYALDAQDGTLRWEQMIGSRHSTATLSMQGEMLVVGETFSPTLQVLHAHDGSLAWETELAGSHFSAALCTADTIYIASNTSLYARDAQDGSSRWRYDLPGETPYSSAEALVLIENSVVFCAPDGYLYALRA